MTTPKGEMKTTLKKGPWSLGEDRLLIDYINRYGIWNWSHMPKFAGLLRSGKSCRLRWMNYLKPDLNKDSFSEKEEQSILHFHSILGNRWSAIARKLPGRSDNKIKNYWHSNLKKRVANNSVIKRSKQKEINMSSTCFQSHDVQNIKDENHVNDNSNLLSSWTSEDDNSTSSGTPIPNGYQTEFTGDIGSLGTVDDLQYFWRELYPLKDLELRNIDQEMFHDHIFQYSYDDTIAPWSFYNNEYDFALTSI